ncbi:MAG: hypothetical protein ACT4OF_00040 [Caulobacteraceae bacterium]
MKLLVVAAVALAGCATRGEEAPLGPPLLEVSANIPAPERAELYADCIAQAAAEHTYFREERDATLLRFNCRGAVAQRFFEGLHAHSARVGSEIVAGTRTWRFTQPIRQDTIGLDYCWRDQANASAQPAYECTVVLNVGEFLRD